MNAINQPGADGAHTAAAPPPARPQTLTSPAESTAASPARSLYDGPRLPPMRIDPAVAAPPPAQTKPNSIPLLNIAIAASQNQPRQLFEHVDKQRKHRRPSPPTDARRHESVPSIVKKNQSRHVRPLFVPQLSAQLSSLPPPVQPQAAPVSAPAALPAAPVQQSVQQPVQPQQSSAPAVLPVQPQQPQPQPQPQPTQPALAAPSAQPQPTAAPAAAPVQQAVTVQAAATQAQPQAPQAHAQQAPQTQMQQHPQQAQVAQVPMGHLQHPLAHHLGQLPPLPLPPMPPHPLSIPFPLGGALGGALPFGLSPPADGMFIQDRLGMQMPMQQGHPHGGMSTPPHAQAHDQSRVQYDARLQQMAYPPNPYMPQPQLQQLYDMSVVLPQWSQLYGHMQPTPEQQMYYQEMAPKMAMQQASAPEGATWDGTYPANSPHLAATQTYAFSEEIKRRTKTGCLTCRKRRVKCDEQHPLCRNCQKSERVCLGYDPVFHADRMYGFQELTNLRREFRAARRKKLAAKLGKPVEGSPESPKNEVVLCTWLEIAKAFQQRLARPLDQLLGTDEFSKLSFRCVEFLSVSPDHLITVAGEAEVMRQLLATVYPNLVSLGLSILDSTVALEKLRTSVDYYFLRAMAESLYLGTEPPVFKEKFPNSFPRNVESVKHLDLLHKRARNLGSIIHNQIPPCSANFIGEETVRTLVRSAERDYGRYASLVWDFVDLVLAGSEIERGVKVEIGPIVDSASEDPRSMLALLALDMVNCEPAHEALETIEPVGLCEAMFEIAMICRQKNA